MVPVPMKPIFIFPCFLNKDIQVKIIMRRCPDVLQIIVTGRDVKLIFISRADILYKLKPGGTDRERLFLRHSGTFIERCYAGIARSGRSSSYYYAQIAIMILTGHSDGIILIVKGL
jgi:hypothetical protein